MARVTPDLGSMMDDCPSEARPLIQDLLGCGWGRQVWTPDDTEECGSQAVQIVVIHGHGHPITVKLCAHHRERVQQETTPHKGGG